MYGSWASHVRQPLSMCFGELLAYCHYCLQFIVDTVMGNYWMLLISSFAYSAGLGFLTMSTPPVLAKAMGTCSEYKPECIGDGQQILFYTALALIAIGVCGHITSWGPFMAEQLNERGEIDEGTFWRFFCSILAVIIITIVAVIALPYIKPWSIRFGIPAICTLVATLLFFTGSCSYNYFLPQGSPLTTFVRVFVASTSKFLYASPKDVKKLYENPTFELELVPYTRSLRCLDKAAIIVPSKTLEEQQKNRWRLCTVTEVEETKTIIRMIPVWLTFIFCGVVSSIGFTYFIEQLDHLNPKVGRLKVPPIVLLWFYDQAKTKCGEFYVTFANSLGESGSRKIAPAIGITVSMIFAILCCITAAKVENRRLGVVQKHGLIDKPDETVPMTMFWLLPQFLLLAALDGIFECSAVTFFIDQAPISTRRYLPFFVSGVFGVGVLGSVLSVYVTGKISERGGKLNWFQHTLNRSRLDKYYWTLAWLAAINLVIFIVVAIFYRYKESELQDLGAPEFGETDEPFDDNAKCCCC
ncbi:Protein NRT1/PTR FAMILY 5.5 [Abeliophyllum distichum]|uniref:Protein NRT1/PTR FAMILY 5.5 n=1 Tax=Abeliophyllum distichum TaxID=126358 RepID=A0ABD1QUB7_9LAMI